MGHHSVAEHAIFNFDIVGISRLAIEELEHFRLCSFTEKSQRYITLENDYVMPEEIKNSKYSNDFVNVINTQNALYHKLHKKLFENIIRKYPNLAKDPKNQNLLEGWAKEDARYITALATQGQLGHTLNARNLELVLRRFAGHRLSEVRELGRTLWTAVENVAPSIILFYNANDYDQKTYKDLKDSTDTLIINKNSAKTKEEVKLVNFTKDADNITLSAIMHTSTELPFDKCLRLVKKLTTEQKMELFKAGFKYMEFYDSALREFEYASLTYDMVISASCFAQLKRHRISTMTCQGYDPCLGLTIPESIKEVGMEDEFVDAIGVTEKLYCKIKKDIPSAAPYILTNAHRRRVLFNCNAREMYHISRLREDNHAQWDIRNIAKKMSDLARGVMPLLTIMICGKDVYPERYKEIFGQFPKVVNTGR
jgi:flavin-dependent thymidylate synthase